MPSTKITRKFYGKTTPGRRADTSNLADYNDSFDVKLPAKLTETLKGVTAHIFPLNANLGKMQAFLDRYLNFPDATIGKADEDPPVYFKPAAPFVLLEVANYSRISENITTVGWFSQREIAFGMAVEWYARRGDDLEFLKYALIYPYVYVDSQLGIEGGRQIYGWSKAPIEIALLRKDGKHALPVPPAPVFDRPTDELLLAANLLMPQNVPGAEDLSTKLLEIKQSRYLQAAGSALPDLLTAVPRALNASINAAWDLTKFFYGASEYGASQLGQLSKMLPQYREIMTRYLPSWITQTSSYKAANDAPGGSATSIITMKQVREVDDIRSDLACYQGIVESTMRIERISDGGSLVDLTNPDASAGICIDLYGRNGHEAEMLELGIESQEIKSDANGTDVRTFRVSPFLPFWVEMDLKYGLADYQAWRTNWTGWTESNSPTLRSTPRSIPYIRLGAGAPLEIKPPSLFPFVRMRFFPLPARKAVIEGLTRNYLANNYDASHSYFNFTRNGSFPPGSGAPVDPDDKGDPAVVVAILSDFENMETAGYSDYELTFAIPIKWTDNRFGKCGTGLMHAYTFAATYWNTITTAEVYGRATLRSSFLPAAFTSILPPRVDKPNLALTLSSEIFPDKTPYQRVEELKILEVYESFSAKSNPTFETLQRSYPLLDATKEVSMLLGDLGLSSIKDGNPFYSIALKQVRDAGNTGKADYQASVWLQRTFIQNPQINGNHFYKPELELHFFEYANFSIKRSLGLIPIEDGAAPSKEFCVVKAIMPFLLEGQLKPGATYIGWWNIGNNWKPAGSSP